MAGRTGSRLYSLIIRTHIAYEMEFMLPVAKSHCSVCGLFRKDLCLWIRARGAFFHAARQFFGLWRKFSDTCSQKYGHIRRHANWKLALEQIFIWTASRELHIRWPKNQMWKQMVMKTMTEAVTFFGQHVRVQFYIFLAFPLMSSGLVQTS